MPKLKKGIITINKIKNGKRRLENKLNKPNRNKYA